jgi:lipid-binding SYLF domain-containing protein
MRQLYRLSTIVLAATVAIAFMGATTGCQTAPKNDTARANLLDEAQASLHRFERSDNSIPPVLDRSAGYAVFPSVGKGGFIVGGGYGKGVVYEGRRAIGYADISEATLGLQAGGQSFSELIIFQDQEALNRFKSGSYGLGAEASAVAIKPGAAAQAEFKKGVMVFTLTGAGLMAEAAVAGQKFRYSDGLHVPEANTASERREPGATNTNTNSTTDVRANNNISGSASVSTPGRGDTNAGGTAKVGGSGSVSTPNTDTNASTDRTTTTTEKTTVERKTTDDPSK